MQCAAALTYRGFGWGGVAACIALYVAAVLAARAVGRMSGEIVVYWSSVSGSLVTKREQQHIFDTLSAHRAPFVAVDIAASENASAKCVLREGSPRGLALPQIHVGGRFSADYGMFVEAVENGLLPTLLAPREPAPAQP